MRAIFAYFGQVLVKVFAPIFYPKGCGGASALFGCMARLPTAWLDVVRESRIVKALRTGIETPTFQKQAERVWSEDERFDFIT